MSEPIYTAVGFCTCGFCTGHRDQSGGVQGLQGDKGISARVIKDVRHNFFFYLQMPFCPWLLCSDHQTAGQMDKKGKIFGNFLKCSK